MQHKKEKNGKFGAICPRIVIWQRNMTSIFVPETLKTHPSGGG